VFIAPVGCEAARAGSNEDGLAKALHRSSSCCEVGSRTGTFACYWAHDVDEHIFIIQNTDRIRFQFLFWTFTWPLWWYTIMTALFGALVWFGLGVMRRHRRRVERRAARY
jgi:hypothetical protein